MQIRHALLAAPLLAALLVATTSCDRAPTRPNADRSVSLAIATHYVAAAASSGLPITRIRVVAMDRAAESVVARLDTIVNPNDTSWPISLDVTVLRGTTATIDLEIELLNDPAGGTPSVEWSGLAGPIELNLGLTTKVADVELGRGPLSNATVTSVTIDGEPLSLVEGESATATATVIGASGEPVVFWSSTDETVATVDANGTIQALSAGTSMIIAAAGARADTMALQVLPPPPAIALSLQDVDRISLGHEATIVATLSHAAPAGGLAVTFGTSVPNTVVFEVFTMTIPEGATSGTMLVFGGSEGTSRVSAGGAGYVSGTLDVVVELRQITIPRGFSVPYGRTASLPITLAHPAPAGGLPVTIETRDAATISVSTATVTIPAGALSANATIQGEFPGTALIVATHPWYDGDSIPVTSAASLNVSATTVTLNQSFGSSVLVRLESGGAPIAAPSSGIAVTLAAVDPTCVSVPPTTTIPAGQVEVSVPITYGGTARTPCATRIDATAKSIAGVSTSATVEPTPSITVGGATVGSGLQRQMTGLLGADNHGGVTVRLYSDPAVALLAPDAVTPGSGILDVVVPAGQTQFTYYVQALEAIQASLILDVVAPGFNSGSAQIDVVQPAADLTGLATTQTAGGADDEFQARLGIPNATLSAIAEFQAVRAGAPKPMDVGFTSTNSAVGSIATSSTSGTVIFLQFQPGQSQTPLTLALGGVAFRPVAAGTVRVTGSVAGGVTVTTSTWTVTVSP